MKIVHIIIVSIIVLLVAHSMKSAVFSLRFEGSNGSKVAINGTEYGLSTAQREVRVDTGLYSVQTIAWTESLVIDAAGAVKNNFDPDKDRVIENTYELTLPRMVHPFNVGGSFTIRDKGAYAYYFGLDGSGEGTAQQIGTTKKAW